MITSRQRQNSSLSCSNRAGVGCKKEKLSGETQVRQQAEGQWKWFLRVLIWWKSEGDFNQSPISVN